jgi:hypothetical protein
MAVVRTPSDRDLPIILLPIRGKTMVRGFAFG